VSDGLARSLLDLLAGRSEGLSCDEIAARLRRRRSDVLVVLQADPRFEHNGRTHGSRWRTTPRDGMGRVENATRADGRSWPELDPSGVPVIARGPESA
jgi:hypothetical protein